MQSLYEEHVREQLQKKQETKYKVKNVKKTQPPQNTQKKVKLFIFYFGFGKICDLNLFVQDTDTKKKENVDSQVPIKEMKKTQETDYKSDLLF